MAKKQEEMKDLDSEDLAQKIVGFKQELFDLRMQRAEGKLAQPHRIRQARRDIARALTLQKQRNEAGAKKS